MSNMDQTIKIVIATVVGAGILIGTAGVFIYQQVFEEKKRRIRQQHEIQKLDITVSNLRKELEALRKLQASKKRTPHRRSARSTSTLDKESEYEMYSAVDTDDGSEEFFDLSDGDEEYEEMEGVRLPNGDRLAGGEQHRDPIIAQLISTTDVLLQGPADDKRTAYAQLREGVKAHPECGALWWRAAKACHYMGTMRAAEGDTEGKRKAIEEGIGYGERSISLDPRSSDGHKWYAILVGSRGEFLTIREKIEDGFTFKKHVDIAREISPEDASLYHLLGRFKYEVAMLTWIERKLATTLFAEPPSATLPDALADCLRAEELHTQPWKDNRLLLAKCCIAGGDYAAAVSWLDRAAEIPVVTPDDEEAHKEVTALLSKYGSYRPSP